MALFNFVDKVGPAVTAAYLNAVDLIRNAVSAVAGGSVTVAPVTAGGNPGTTALTISQSGNLTLATPVSGTTLTVNSIPGSNALVVQDGSGVVVALITQGGTNAQIGSSSNHPLVLFTNNTNRAIISAAGNLTLNAPTSGVAATLNVVDNTAALALNEAAFTSGYYLAFQVAGTTKSFIGFGGIMGNGTGQNDLAVECNVNTGNINLIQGSTSGKIQGLGPVAAAMVDMTPDSGSFTGSLTGLTAAINSACTWRRIGSQVTLHIGSAIGISNATTMTMTGLPAAIQTTFVNTQHIPIYLQDNGNSQMGAANFQQSSGTLVFGGTLAQGAGGGGFTASGQKGFAFDTQISYVIS